MYQPNQSLNPKLDLILERVVEVPRKKYGAPGPNPNLPSSGLLPRRGILSIAKSIFDPAALSTP